MNMGQAHVAGKSIAKQSVGRVGVKRSPRGCEVKCANVARGAGKDDGVFRPRSLPKRRSRSFHGIKRFSRLTGAILRKDAGMKNLFPWHFSHAA